MSIENFKGCKRCGACCKAHGYVKLRPGEAEAIALAVQMKAEWLLLDEQEARRVAKALGLKVTGILGILLRAKRLGNLPSLQKSMDQLRARAGFRIGAELYTDLIRESGEGRDD